MHVHPVSQVSYGTKHHHCPQPETNLVQTKRTCQIILHKKMKYSVPGPHRCSLSQTAQDKDGTMMLSYFQSAHCAR